MQQSIAFVSNRRLQRQNLVNMSCSLTAYSMVSLRFCTGIQTTSLNLQKQMELQSIRPLLPGPQRSCQDLLVILLGKLQAAGNLPHTFVSFLPLCLFLKQCGGNNKQKTDSPVNGWFQKLHICWYRKVDCTFCGRKKAKLSKGYRAQCQYNKPPASTEMWQ